MSAGTTEAGRSGKLSFVLMAGLLACGLGLAFYANAWKEDRRVAQVVVQNNRFVSEKEILALAKVPVNSPMFGLDLYAIEQRVGSHQFVKSVAVHRDLPNRIRITVDERIPVAIIAADPLLCVDQEGYVLNARTSSHTFDLPVLTGLSTTQDLVIGRRTQSRHIHNALSLLRRAQEIDGELYRNISEVCLDKEKNLMFYTAEFGIPVILGEEDAAGKMVMFESFWKQIVASQGAHRLEYIDLRFEDQVVVRWNRHNGDAHS